MKMEMPRLEIEQQPSKIDLNIKKNRFELEQENSQLEVRQEVGKLNVNIDMVEVRVDGYPHHYDLGYKNPQDRSKEIAVKGQQTAQEATLTYAREGDRLADIPASGNVIAEQAKKASEDEEVKVGLRWKRGPEFEVTTPELEIKYKPVPPQIKVALGTVKGNLHWGRVKVTMAQYYNTEISVTGGQLNRLI
jgi:hypothetical protein